MYKINFVSHLRHLSRRKRGKAISKYRGRSRIPRMMVITRQVRDFFVGDGNTRRGCQTNISEVPDAGIGEVITLEKCRGNRSGR